MGSDSEISKHYGRGDLLERLQAALIDDGVDPVHATVETLAPFDHFHGRGLEATKELADALELSATDHILPFHLLRLWRVSPDFQALAVAAMSCSAVRLPSSSPFSKSPSTLPI